MPTHDLKRFHAMASNNVLKTKLSRTAARSVGYSANTDSLQEKDLASGHKRAVPYKFIPVGREIREDIRQSW